MHLFFSASLAKISNMSLGIFPDGWKCANVSPIFKNGSESDTSNYRPISALSTLSARVFERLIYEQLSEYLEENNYLSKYQSGFQKFHSTIKALLKSTNDLLTLTKVCSMGPYFLT